jgi:hypothetical protein
VLENYSPDERIIPFVSSQEKSNVLSELLDYPQLGDESQPYWADILTEELHRSKEIDYATTDQASGDYPIFGGENFHQLRHDDELGGDAESVSHWGIDGDDPDEYARARVREKRFNSGNLKKAIYTKFRDKTDISTRSQIGFTNDLLQRKRGRDIDMGDVLLDADQYRIGYRDVANVGNEYTMIAAVLPPETLLFHTAQSFRPLTIEVSWDDLNEYPLHGAYEHIFTDKQLFAMVGLLNSIPFDYLIRTKVDEHLVKYKVEESTVPRLTESDEWFDYIWRRAARLNCYGDAFDEMRSRLGRIEPITDDFARRQARIEIDAAAFHAYNLAADEVEFVLDDFNTIQNPDLRDQPYFESVLEKYRELSDNQPAGN